MSALLALARPVVAALAPCALAAVIGAVAWHHTPFIGPAARYERLSDRYELAATSAAAWERHARGWMTSYGLSENRRLLEARQAEAATTAAAAQCRTSIDAARRSARAIERIINDNPEQTHAESPADRRLVDPDRLRDALRPGG